MRYQESQKVTELKHRVRSFMDRYVYPNEERYYREAEELGPWQAYPVAEELKPKAREEGLWNLFLPESEPGAGIVQLLRARHRQHGGAGALRHAGASGALAQAATGR